VDGPLAVITVELALSGEAGPGPEVIADLARIERSLTGQTRFVAIRIDGPDPPERGEPDPASFEPTSFEPAQAAPATPEPARSEPAPADRPVTFPRRADLISVAVLTGAVPPPWMDLAFLCDLRLAAADARLRLGAPGRLPRLGASGALVRLVGYPRALELLLTGAALPARRAHALGLVEWVGPRAELEGHLDGLAQAALSWPRERLAELKTLLAGAVTGPAGPGAAGATGLDRALAAARLAETEAAERLRRPG
jgi:Enoyl-CoA hydratase/isomerase